MRRSYGQTAAGKLVPQVLDASGAVIMSSTVATPVASRFTTISARSVTTNASGAVYNAFASFACTALDIVNTSSGAVDIEYQRGGSGVAIPIPAGTARMVFVSANASEIALRRADVSNTVVTVAAEAYVI